MSCRTKLIGVAQKGPHDWWLTLIERKIVYLIAQISGAEGNCPQSINNSAGNKMAVGAASYLSQLCANRLVPMLSVQLMLC